MSFKVDISWEQIQEFVDEIVWKYTDKHLSDVEVQVLKGSWEGKRYEDIATELHLTTTYIQNDVGAKLWKKLTDIIGEPVSKSNFRQALYRERENRKRCVPYEQYTITKYIKISFRSIRRKLRTTRQSSSKDSKAILLFPPSSKTPNSRKCS